MVIDLFILSCNLYGTQTFELECVSELNLHFFFDICMPMLFDRIASNYMCSCIQDLSSLQERCSKYHWIFFPYYMLR